MERFAVDLDKVLDEFELNEDLASVELANKKPNHRPLVSNSAALVDGSARLAPCISDADSESIYDESFAPTIDLSGADFGAIPLITESFGCFDKMSGGCDEDVLSFDADDDHSLSVVTEGVRVTNGDALLKDVGDAECNGGYTNAKNPGSSITAAVDSWSNVESGIKELHCDEVLNKDFLVTFGRRLDVRSLVESHNVPISGSESVPTVVSKCDADSNTDPSSSKVVGKQSQEAEEGPLSTAVQDIDAGTELSQGEVFVTPDYDSSDSAVDVAPVSFHSDVNVTDDELDSYLKDEEEEEIPGSLEDALREQLPLNRNAFFTPSSDDAHNDFACHTRDDENDAREENDDSESEEAPSISLDVELVNTTSTGQRSVAVDVPDLASSSEHVMSNVLLCLLPDSEDSPVEATLPDGMVHSDDVIIPGEHFEESFEPANSPEDADEGYEAGEASPPTDNARILRPTSLFLPEKLDYHPPANSSPCRDEVVAHVLEERLPFSSLVSTAGSPEAVSFVTPLSAPECAAAVAESFVENECILGRVAPVWVPDSDAPNCMQCDVRFTVIKRRHHCRACGKVLCASCCGMKARLRYMDNKEARVCLNCVDVMKRVEALESEEGVNLADGFAGATPRSFQAITLPSRNAISRSPNPNNPSEYCSMIPPLEQAQLDAPPPTVMVPVGVLKRTGAVTECSLVQRANCGRAKGEPKQVMFSDGIRPGGDLTELDAPEEPVLPSRRQPTGRTIKKVDQKMTDQSCLDLMSNAKRQSRSLPQALVSELSVDDPLDMSELLPVLQDESADPCILRVTKNLRVLVKIISLDCCMHKTCWSFTTQGMGAVGQDEIVVLLEMLPNEQVIPGDIFRHLADVYEDASKGVTVSGMGHSIFSQSFLGSREHGGFLYVRSTFQCLSNLVLPPAPYLFAVLLQKWETPWAKVFPLRLFLRLGAESRYYPCPLVGTRFRKPVYCEIGHTIMNLLADFRNYQYTLPAIPGLTIHMEDKQTFIGFPRNRYDEVVKAINSSIDHVLALAATFNVQADSHLVCIQGEDGTYHTQAINIKDKPRKVTGASFVVFNGALKTSTGLTAKSSIVEDGLMVQISSDSNQALRQSLRDMKDYVIACGPIGAEQPDDIVHLRWVDDDRNVNVGVQSPIDGMHMDGISSIRIHCGTDYVGDGLVIRWTEVYLVKTEDGRRSDPVDLGKISDCLAGACCLALTPHLVDLFSSGFFKIGLRVTLDADNVGYEVGGCGEKLPYRFMNDLDGELVPAIHGATAQDGAVILELIFHILRQ